MEQETQEKKEDGSLLILANRKMLFRLLSFLDRKLPECCAIHSFVSAALLIATGSSYRIYFRRKHTVADDDDFSVIVGSRIETLVDSNNQIQKCWTLTAWTDDDELLSEAYSEVDLINWNEDNVIIHYKRFTPPAAVTNFLISKHGQSEHCYLVDQYFINIKDAASFQLRKMDKVYVKSLERCHAQLVYDNWPYRESTTVEHVADEIDHLPSAGVFLKESDELVSWIMCHPPNGMSRLHTLEQHRRRGYAALVTQYLSKRVAQSGCVPFVNIVTDNDDSYKFFESMKFQLLRPGHIIVSRSDLAC